MKNYPSLRYFSFSIFDLEDVGNSAKTNVGQVAQTFCFEVTVRARYWPSPVRSRRKEATTPVRFHSLEMDVGRRNWFPDSRVDSELQDVGANCFAFILLDYTGLDPNAGKKGSYVVHGVNLFPWFYCFRGACEWSTPKAMQWHIVERLQKHMLLSYFVTSVKIPKRRVTVGSEVLEPHDGVLLTELFGWRPTRHLCIRCHICFMVMSIRFWIGLDLLCVKVGVCVRPRSY